MKKLRYWLFLLLIVGMLQGSGATQSQQPPTPPGDYAAGTLLVKFKNSPSGQLAQAANAQVGATMLQDFSFIGWQYVQLPEGMTVAEGMAAYQQLPNVLAVEPNYMLTLATTPDDTRFNELWSLNNTGQTGGVADADIDAPEAWNLSTGSSSVVVAVLDTGILYTHPDLAANMWHNPGEIPGNGIDDDGNGFVDDVYGIDTASHDSDPLDDAGHGTHVAGIIGAVGNNNLGVTGINWSVSIMALKIFNNGSGFTTEAIAAFQYAAMMKNRGVNIRVTNNSYASQFFGDPALKDAIDAAGDAGILNVFASGNMGLNLDTTAIYPASFDSPSLMAVAATDDHDNLTSWSNYSATSVDLGVPGNIILSTTIDGSYGQKTGTSMASPHVAGAAALLSAYDSSLSVASLKATLIDTVDVLPGYADKTVAGGRLNVARALQQPTVCAGSMATASQSFTANPGSGLIDVAISAHCDWAAVSNDSFITIVSGQGMGDGTVEYAVAANTTGSARTGTITVAEQTFTVTQSGPPPSSCADSIAPTSQSVGMKGSTGSVTVTAPGSCNWTATSNDFWITITSGGSGTGNGTVHFSVAANSDNARTGTLAIANRTFTITQASPCVFSIFPTDYSFTRNGGFGAFNVTATGGTRCDWTAISNDSWIIIYPSYSSGTGNGLVIFTVAVNNSGDTRTGTITIADQTFTVTQGYCEYTLAPATSFFPAAGGTDAANVTVTGNCGWTAFSSDSWITITSGSSGTGNGTITYTVNDNLSADFRRGSLNITGQQQLIIIQEGRHQHDKIVFATTRDGNNEIYTMNVDGSNPTNITNNAGSDNNPVWSPDGTKIAFYSDRDGNSEVYVMDADGSNPVNLTNAAGSDVNPAWSPDGTKIAFQAYRNGTAQIYVMNADGSNQSRLTNNTAYDSWPTWSPDGTKIVFMSTRDGNSQIYVMDADGSNQVRLNNNSATETMPAWSPDGTRIAFVSDRDGNLEIYTINPDGGNPVRLTTNAAVELGPSWSPDGSKLTFMSNRDGNYELYVMNADGSNQKRLTMNAASDSYAVWQPVPFDCTFDISPASTAFDAEGGQGGISVSGDYGCIWQAVSCSPWITITQGRSFKEGEVLYDVEPNLSNAPRRGTIVVGRHLFTVTQAGTGN